ncbi:RNA polymerase subunit sigma-70 [Streptomyces sp. V4-01]|uniref:RNA polymerase subunit sigma-70 n=1 Tax=Actinacidiphila polyblastidii TaxID=3110430 RepID=A0ABU7PD91_9ACTN|nr:RNA polymerase subunit sigma-70 [Streptomyces sp. V4-01]
MTPATEVPHTDQDFAARCVPYRRELHVHCYRMLASYDEAEDAVQETLLRAWKAQDSFQGEQPRAWLYKIATNVCLDQLRRLSRRLTEPSSFAEVPWLQPYPDGRLDEIAPAGEEPDAVAVDRETIELAFLAALQVLPARQRAVFVARDVLGRPAAECADMLGTSVAAANSALQRARTSMRERLPQRRADWSAGETSAVERELLDAFIAAHESGNTAAALAISAKDIRVTMPPHPRCFQGVDELAALMARAFGPELAGNWRLVPTRANRMPTAASYLRAPGDQVHRAFKFDVLRIAGGRIAEITTFGPELFPAFGLPPTL